MADINSILSSIIRAANEVTDMNDTTVTNAVQSLMDGYGQGGGLDFLKFGMVTIPAVSNSNTNHTIVTLSEIGFEPKHMIMFRDSISKTSGAIHVTDYHNYGADSFRKAHRWYSNAWSNQNNGTAFTASAAGMLWLDGDTIKAYSTTNYNFPAGTYYWVAIGTPNI